MQPKDIGCTVVFDNQDHTERYLAFNQPGILIMLRWGNMVSDRSREAREAAHEMAGSILGDKSLIHDPLSFVWRVPRSSGIQFEIKPFVDGNGPAES
jgi:hypothetical protein